MKEAASGSLGIEGVTCAERRRLVQPPQPVGAVARRACSPAGAAGPHWTFSGCLQGWWASGKGSCGRSRKTNQQQLKQFTIYVYQLAKSPQALVVPGIACLFTGGVEDPDSSTFSPLPLSVSWLLALLSCHTGAPEAISQAPRLRSGREEGPEAEPTRLSFEQEELLPSQELLSFLHARALQNGSS